MLTELSPAKTLDFDHQAPTRRSTQPRFLEQSAALVEDAAVEHQARTTGAGLPGREAAAGSAEEGVPTYVDTAQAV